MILLLILLAASLAIIVETLRVVRHDGRGPQRPPASHHEDARFRAPSAV